MESFSNFLKSISETINGIQIQQPQQTQQTTEDIRRESTSNSESGYTSQNSSRRSSAEAAEKEKRMRRIKNQAMEDDDEGNEATGRSRHANNMPSNSIGFTSAAIGISALALGTYAIGKMFMSPSEPDVPEFPTTPSDIAKAIKKIEEDIEAFPVIGLDCQWTLTTAADGSRNKIALLQLCSSEGNMAIIPINKIYTYPENLKAILRNQRIIKAGVETIKDARYLLEDYGLIVTSTYDIRYLAEDCGHQPLGLEKLAERILGLDLGRDWELIASDWNKDPLDDNQKSYAEKSVKASIDIFKALIPFAITTVNRNEILNYCYEHVDRAFVYYSHRH